MFFDTVQIGDENINKGLFAIKMLAMGKPSKPPHITVRGPYKTQTPQDKLNEYTEKIKRFSIKVKGIGSFENNDNVVIFLKCEAPHLKKIWDKPSYPIEEYGFNPHITLYEGPKSKFSTQMIELFDKYQDLSFEITSPSLETLMPKSHYSSMQKSSLKILDSNFSVDGFSSDDKTRVNLIEKLLSKLFPAD